MDWIREGKGSKLLHELDRLEYNAHTRDTNRHVCSEDLELPASEIKDALDKVQHEISKKKAKLVTKLVKDDKEVFQETTQITELTFGKISYLVENLTRLQDTWIANEESLKARYNGLREEKIQLEAEIKKNQVLIGVMEQIKEIDEEIQYMDSKIKAKDFVASAKSIIRNKDRMKKCEFVGTKIHTMLVQRLDNAMLNITENSINTLVSRVYFGIDDNKDTKSGNNGFLVFGMRSEVREIFEAAEILGIEESISHVLHKKWIQPIVGQIYRNNLGQAVITEYSEGKKCLKFEKKLENIKDNDKILGVEEHMSVLHNVSMLVDFVSQELVSNSDKYKWIREIFKFTNDADDHMASKDWYVSIFNGFDERKFTISEYERQTNEFEAKLVAVGVLLPSENIFSKNIRLDYTKYKAKIILDKIRSEVLKPDFEEVQTKELTPNEYFSLLDNSNHSIKGFSDKFLTKIPPITISKAAFHLVQQCIELLSLEIRISNNNDISSDLSARLVSNDAEEQAGSLSPLPHTAFIKKSITTLFEIYTCLRYNYHYKNITKIGHLCVVYFNDMMYLTLFAEYLLSMDYLDPKAVKEKELIQLMTDSGKQVLELWLHKTCASEIKSIIDQIRGFDNIQSANSYKVSEIKTALKKVVYYISKTSSSINKALVTKEIHNLIVGYLLDLFLNCVIDELCKLNSIGARESEILNELLDFNNMVLGADVPGTDEFEINATYINSLEKYHQIIDILVLNMKDIVKRHKLGLLASVDSNTVVGLIKSLFEDSEKRRSNIEYILNS